MPGKLPELAASLPVIGLALGSRLAQTIEVASADLVLPISRKSLFSRRRSWSSRRLFPALALVQFDQFLDRRRILRLLVSLPEGDQPRKA